ncbi:MAG: MFS transporter [Dehalococcoidia bacterium]
MFSRQVSPPMLLLLLSVAVFLNSLSLLVLGPLLVEIAEEFNTSVATIGQIGGAIAIPWAVTAPLAGPVSDTYGRRLLLLSGLMLLGLGVLGSGLAWNNGSLLAFRLLTGVGAAMIPPNCIAAVADVFPAEGRGKAIGWLLSAFGIGAAFGVGMVAFLFDVGGWRLPFYVIGASVMVLWILLWVWFPPSQRQPGQTLSFISHYKEVGTNATIRYALVVNALLQMVFFGVFSYLAARLIQTYGMEAGEIVLPLTLAGLGVIAGGFIGGRVAGHRHRLVLLAIAALVSGLLAVLIFVAPVSPWPTVVLALVVGSMTTIASVVTPALLIELAGRARSTAAGIFAFSNQIGVFGGASIGGAMLALGGFPLVGFFCLGMAIVAAAVVRIKVRDSAEFLEQIALRESKSA